MSVPEVPLQATADPPASPRRSLRPLILRLHFYAGLLAAPFILVAALTGALYAAAPTLERLVVYPDLLTVQPDGEPAPLSEQAAAAGAAFPDLVMSGMRPPPGPTDSTRVNFVDPTLGADVQRAVFVDPYTAEVLGNEPVWFGYLPFSTWLDGLHRHLNLGEPGRVYSELAASWLWVIALGGVFLWIAKARNDRRRERRTRVLRVDGSATGRSRALSWHGATGIWIVAMLLFLSATGITWSRFAGETVSEIRSALNWQRPELDTAMTAPTPAAPDAIPPAIDFAAVLSAAEGAGVRLPVEITLPGEPGQAIGVTEVEQPYRLTTNAAAVDSETLEVTGVVDYERDYSVVAKLADWGIRMHMGMLFGLANQMLLLLVAVSLITVIVLGYRMWWHRRPTRGSAWAFGRPPARGAWRSVHPGVAAGAVVVALAVGWFLPLLGLSLAAFLLVDVVVGACRRRARPAALRESDDESDAREKSSALR